METEPSGTTGEDDKLLEQHRIGEVGNISALPRMGCVGDEKSEVRQLLSADVCAGYKNGICLRMIDPEIECTLESRLYGTAATRSHLKCDGNEVNQDREAESGSVAPWWKSRPETSKRCKASFAPLYPLLDRIVIFQQLHYESRVYAVCMNGFNEAIGDLTTVDGDNGSTVRQNLLCDVVLKAGSVEVPAHKNVLAASSPYFHAMFTGDMTESRARTVTIGNIDGTALSLLVDFIYTAEVLITEETVQCLLPAANLLQLTSVREACCEFLQCQLHPTNCLGIQRFADMHDCSELLQVSRRFTEQHCGEVLEHGEEFLSLSKEQLINLISSDNIRVSEEQVFEAALRWMRHDPAARGTPEVAAEVCGHVRFGLLPRDYLIRLSLSEEFLRANPWCKDFLLEAMGFLLLPWEQRRRNITSERTRPRSIGVPKVDYD
ncbi:unnamed protein product [Taenia asiatica]|uniref:BTB domain-containing protein n=1 Tax=Taenia asiatica TaxID=60517 RepID=A0A0R3VVW3_TAEAS|nr:unnamed protein product [Taenia asiatica]